MPADDAACARFSGLGEIDFTAGHFQKPDARHGRDQPPFLHLGKMRTFVVHRAFAQHPKLLEHFIEILVLFRRKHHGLDDTAVLQVDAAVGATPRALVVRHQQDRASLGVKTAQEVQHDLLI